MLPALFGVANFAAGALGSIGGFMGQQDQANTQNAYAKQQYKQRQAIYLNDTYNRYSQYNRQKAQANQQYTNNLEASAKAAMAEDMRLNELFKREAFNAQSSKIATAMARGQALASGQSGVSARRAATLINAASGRNTAIGRESLKAAQVTRNVNVNNIRDKLRIADESAYANVAVAPTPGPAPMAPVMRSGPSPVGLFANLAGDALSGFGAYKNADANW